MTGAADMLSGWCAAALGAPVEAVLFRAGYFSEVVGVELANGRRAVAKIRAATPRPAACWRVQRELHRLGFPAPQPLLGPTPYPDGRTATAESLVEPADGNGSARASATLLARLVSLAPPDTGALEPPPAWVRSRHDEPGLWPRPDDDEVDLNSRDIGWIDATSRDVREVLLADPQPPVVAHVDWVPQNVWWSANGTPLAVHDWDSLAAVPVAAAVGVAAAIYREDATVDASAEFLQEYEKATRPWSATERQVAWAAGLWVRLFDAKKDLLAGRGPSLTQEEATHRHRLAVTG